MTDLAGLDACRAQLPELLKQLQARIRRADADRAIRKLFVKIRFADFQKTKVECLAQGVDAAVLEGLLQKGFERGRRPVRLLGIGVRLGEEARDRHDQPGLFQAEKQDGAQA